MHVISFPHTPCRGNGKRTSTMRVMLVTDQYPPMVGGVPAVVHGLAVDFVNRGHTVWVAAPSQGPHDMHQFEQKVRVYRYSSFEWPTYEGLRIPFLPFMPMRNLLKRSDPDIIHIHSPIVLGNIAQILAGGLRKPVIATNHYLPINMSRSLSVDPLFGKPFNTITYSYLVSFCNRCEYVTAPTKTALDLLYQHGLRAPAGVISNGIDLQKFSPGERNVEILQRYNLPTNRPIVLHVNRLSEEKRINILLDAVAKMQFDAHQAHIALAGSGPAEVALREQVEQLHIGDRVTFLGFVDDNDLLGLRRSANLFVIASEADLQSLATLEAMACGLPVIAANSYALPELVHEGENGYLFPPGNSDELARLMDKMLADPALCKQMGARSLEIVAAHDRLKVVEQWESLYRRLSNEFIEARQRKLQYRMARKNPHFKRPAKRPSRIVRTGDLKLEK